MGWQDNAGCKGMSLDVFFDDEPKTMHKSAQIAIKICNDCLVKQECLDYALEMNITAGIFGGYSRKQRIILNRKRKVSL